MGSKDPAEELYKLFLMGLTWLRDENPAVLTRRGSSVFASFSSASPVFQSARLLTMQSWDLKERVEANGKFHRGSKHMGIKELRRHIADAREHCVVMVVPDRELNPEVMFGPRGCTFAITDTGMDYARSVMGGYTAIVDEHKFLSGWGRFKRQMSTLNVRKPQAGRTTETASEEASPYGHIPPAPYEDKFEW